MVLAAAFVLGAVACKEPAPKSPESTRMLRRLAQGARVYAVEHASPESGLRFPVGDTGIEPPGGSCCRAPGGRCASSPSAWGTPLWAALGFVVDEPHHFSYRFVSDGQRFTASAYGDLDCDGTLSTFELIGEVVGAEIKVQPELRKTNDGE